MSLVYFRSIMPFYGEIYLRAWCYATGPNLEVFISYIVNNNSLNKGSKCISGIILRKCSLHVMLLFH